MPGDGNGFPGGDYPGNLPSCIPRHDVQRIKAYPEEKKEKYNVKNRNKLQILLLSRDKHYTWRNILEILLI